MDSREFRPGRVPCSQEFIPESLLSLSLMLQDRGSRAALLHQYRTGQRLWWVPETLGGGQPVQPTLTKAGGRAGPSPSALLCLPTGTFLSRTWSYRAAVSFQERDTTAVSTRSSLPGYTGRLFIAVSSLDVVFWLALVLGF